MFTPIYIIYIAQVILKFDTFLGLDQQGFHQGVNSGKTGQQDDSETESYFACFRQVGFL